MTVATTRSALPCPPQTTIVLQSLGGAAAVAAIAILGVRADDPQRTASVVLVYGVLFAICAYDARTLIAPNILVFPGLVLAVAVSFAINPSAGLESVAGGMVGFAVMLVVALAGRGRMGFGDVKVGAFCGAIVGLTAVAELLLLTFLLGGCIAAVALLSRRRRRTDSMAFTPFLGVATVAVTLISGSYLVR
jgi:prepilin signal peptidase PulO-like enzyme (type II secretory pathway)